MKERIKELRKALGTTQQEFADRIGVKRNTIANYEAGRNEPVSAIMSLICREFAVNERWLRAGEGEMFKPSGSEALAALVKEQGLSRQDAAVIEKFLDLKPEVRAELCDYFVAVARSLTEEDTAVDTQTAMGAIVEAEAAYEKSSGFVPTTGLSASPTTDGEREAGRKKA